MLTHIGYLAAFIFIVSTLFGLFLFLRSIAKSTLKDPAKIGKRVMIFLFLWLLIHAAWGFSGFYREYSVVPPRLLFFGILPALFIIGSIFVFSPWRNGALKLELESLTWIQTVRLLIGLGLFVLYSQKVVAEEMAFSFRNVDVLCGATAPIISWYVFRKNKTKQKSILIFWNIFCLAVLLKSIYFSIFSAPLYFQCLGETQSTIAFFYFPFVWLPTLVMPITLFAHIVSLAQLIKKQEFI